MNFFAKRRFDLQNSNVSDSSLDQYDMDKLADVVRSSINHFFSFKDCFVDSC
jgi:hypothetical protein